jgi:hypothetical protein
MGKFTGDEIKKRYNTLKGERSTWETHWQEIADYFIPRKDNVNKTTTPGEKKSITLLDNTGIQSCELLAGALHGMLTNPNSEWFELSTGDAKLDEQDDVRMFLQDSARRLHTMLNNSNFNTEVHELYLDLCSFATAPMSIEEDDDEVFRFASRQISEVVVEENSKGFVDEVYREFNWSARQIVEYFGMEVLKMSRKVKDAFDKKVDDKFKIIHAVYPQKRVDGQQKGRFPFNSQYILDCDGTELQFKGFLENPFVAPRWSKTTGEKYGRGPGMVALPEMKTLNKMTETTLIGAQKVVDPPMQVPDDGFILPLMTHPGGLNYYRSGSQERIEPIMNDARIDFGYEAMKDRRTRVREAFYVDQLQLGTGPQMTATEVNQRTEEKMRLLGPMLGRMQSEFLKPIIDRCFAIAYRRNLLPAAPMALQGKELTVKYSSMIARAQRQSEVTNVGRTIQAIAPFVQVDPTAMDNFDSDAAVRKIANINGLPQEMLRDQKGVEEIRKSRAQAQQQAVDMKKKEAETANAVDMSTAAKNLSQTGG